MARENDMAEIIDRVEDEDDEDASDYHRPAPPTEPSQVYSVRIPLERLEALRLVASRKSVRPSTLMRQWVIERLDNELTGVPKARIIMLPLPRSGPGLERDTRLERDIRHVLSEVSRTA